VFARLTSWLRNLLPQPAQAAAPTSETVVGSAEFRRIVLRERARSDRNGGSLSLILLDAGGEKGLEEQIETWAATVAERVRCTDAVGWFDGKTLGVVLPDTDHEGALMVVRLLRSKLPADASRAHWRILVHPEHTAKLDGRPKSSGSSGADSSDPLDLLRAPLRPAPVAVAPLAETLRLPPSGGGPNRGASPSVRGAVHGAPFAAANGSQRRIVSAVATLTRERREAPSVAASAPVAQARATKVEFGSLQSLLLVPTSPFKRVVDVTGAALALLALSPVMLAAAVAVKLSSPGPVLFRQQRAGLGGRAFTFYKFRTMGVDAEQRKKDLLAQNEMTGPVFKIAADPRITPVGRILRRTSIDELPQLWNVLVGDMSLVGPRPPIVSEVKDYERWQLRRLDIRGGLTCIWQVSGRSAIQFNDWVRLDLRYVEKASLRTDAALLLKTIPAVLTCRGAH
jgi:lipopolysaccharide/colanic/teichoic acid biosynthesis glycosyltransferase